MGWTSTCYFSLKPVACTRYSGLLNEKYVPPIGCQRLLRTQWVSGLHAQTSIKEPYMWKSQEKAPPQRSSVKGPLKLKNPTS